MAAGPWGQLDSGESKAEVEELCYGCLFPGICWGVDEAVEPVFVKRWSAKRSGETFIWDVFLLIGGMAMTHLPQQTGSFPRIVIDPSGPRNTEYCRVTFWKIQKCSLQEEKEKKKKNKKIPNIAEFLLPIPKEQTSKLLDEQSHVQQLWQSFECQLRNLFDKAYWFLQTNLLKYLSLYKSFCLWDFLPSGHTPMQSKILALFRGGSAAKHLNSIWS